MSTYVFKAMDLAGRQGHAARSRPTSKQAVSDQLKRAG